MKKVLSIILATAMLISLIPAVFAADTETGIKVVYDFYNADLANLASGVQFPLKNLSYTASKGFWQYAANYDDRENVTLSSVGFRPQDGYIYVCAAPTTPKYWLAVKLNVPKQGKYDIKFTTYTTGGTAIARVTSVNAFMFKADETINIKDLVNNTNGELNITNISRNTKKEYTIGTKELDAGEYYFVLNPYHTYSNTTTPAVYLCSLTLTEDGKGTKSVPMYYPGEVEDIQLEVGESKEVTGTMTHWSDGTEYDGLAVTYTGESENEAVAVYENNKIVAKGAGNTTITVKSSDGYFVRDVNVKVVKQDEALTEEFIQAGAGESITDSYVAPSVAGIEIDGSVITPVPNGDGSYNLTAPDKKGDNEFLYWAKGMETKKRIVSFSETLENYVPDESGITYLIAVYEGDITDTKNEYYNINGQLIAKQEEAPTELPSIPGLGKAEGWDPCGGNIYVARYADTVRDNVTVTVSGGTGTQENVPYGTLITCAADATKANFKCWKKEVNGVSEIVSIDESYSFHAWEDCTVEAVYEDHYYTGSNMNILIDSFDVDEGVTGVMAEFIGFENADVVEKGIKFTDSKGNETKIPMTTTDNQLTVVADAGKYEGYAILRNGTAYSIITDGEYENN